MSGEGDVSYLPPVPDLPCEELWWASVVEQDARLIVTGGVCKDDRQARVWTLDTKVSEASWQQAPNMNTVRHSHVSFILDKLVYVACGQGQGGTLLSSIEVIDFTHSHPHWTKVTQKTPH